MVRSSSKRQSNAHLHNKKDVQDEVSAAIKAADPRYYKNFILDMEWIEAQQYLPRNRNPEVFKGAIEMMIRKYMDRCGGKDSELQEYRKALWYMRFLIAYISNGNRPIRIKDIDDLLRG